MGLFVTHRCEQEARITQLEAETKHQGTVVMEMNEQLRRVVREMMQVKWLIMGAVLFYVAHEIGLANALKGFLK